jgi:hypothetical protein
MDKDPKCKRFYRQCQDFSLCVNMGEKGYVLAEHPNERFTIFYYGLYGSGIFGRVFDKHEPIILDATKNEVVDVQKYVHDKIIFESTEDFYIVGFNTNDKSIKWEARIINPGEETIESHFLKSYLLCLNGGPVVNMKRFKRYDYAQVIPDKDYKLIVRDDDILILFSQIGRW